MTLILLGTLAKLLKRAAVMLISLAILRALCPDWTADNTEKWLYVMLAIWGLATVTHVLIGHDVLRLSFLPTWLNVIGLLALKRDRQDTTVENIAATMFLAHMHECKCLVCEESVTNSGYGVYYHTYDMARTVPVPECTGLPHKTATTHVHITLALHTHCCEKLHVSGGLSRNLEAAAQALGFALDVMAGADVIVPKRTATGFRFSALRTQSKVTMAVAKAKADEYLTETTVLGEKQRAAFLNAAVYGSPTSDMALIVKFDEGKS